MKMNKSWRKRFKVTRNGKIIGRRPGQNHNNAKSSGNKRRQKRRTMLIRFVNSKALSRFMPNA